jgi:transposase
MQERLLEFAAFIGIDWADRKHDVCLQVAGADTFEKSIIEHRPTAIDAWARELRKRFDGRPVAVCLELSQGPIVSALLEHDFFVIFPVNPSTLAQYRKAFTPSGAKDDPTDAAVALEILRRHPDKLAPLRRESIDMRALRRLVESRRDLVQDRVRVTNRLIYALKAYFPQILDWFRDKETEVFAAFLERWPSLPEAQRARRDTLIDFFHAHNVRRANTIEKRINAIKSEKPLTTDPGAIEPALLLVETMLPQLRALSAGIVRFDDEIHVVARCFPTFACFPVFPARARSSHLVFSLPLASSATASRPLLLFRS